MNKNTLATICVLILSAKGAIGRAADLPPQTRPSTQPVVVPATIDAFEQVDLYPKLSGYVLKVEADIGDTVKEKQALATLNVPELEKDLAEATASLTARKKMLDAASAAIEQSRKTSDVAQKQVARYQADASFQELTFKRQEELFAGKAITSQQLDDSRVKIDISRADVAIAAAKFAASEADIAGAQAAHAVATAQVEVAAAQIEKIQTLLEYRDIVAPFNGTVTRRMVNRGDLVQAAVATRSWPLFTVQRIDVMRVRCDVPESSAARILPGALATVKVFGLAGETFTATVARSARSLNPETRTMRVEIDLPNPQGRLLAGMYAQVTLTPDPDAAKPATAPAR